MPNVKPIHMLAAVVRDEFRRSHPWYQDCDSPLKYVDWALNETVKKSWLLAYSLSPPVGARVFEFGPGAGYLLHFLREAGCDVSGCDVPDRPLYRRIHELLGINTVVDETIQARRPIESLQGQYDYLIGTQISWMDAWSFADVQAFLQDCYSHLTMTGRIVLFPNPKACSVAQQEIAGDAVRVILAARPPIERLVGPTTLALPWLGEGVLL
jgi:SAM-dependent methyltransferase